MSAATVVRPYPFDIEQLKKGDLIPPEVCERLCSYPRSHRKYGLELCTLKEALEKQWLEARGEVLTVCIERDGLRICADGDAIGVNEARFNQGRRKLRRLINRVAGIDRGNLTSEQCGKQERLLVTASAFRFSGEKAMRVALKPHTRQTPGLLK